MRQLEISSPPDRLCRLLPYSEPGESYSDHVATVVTMQYTVTGELNGPDTLETEHLHLVDRFFNGVARFAKALFLPLSAAIQQGIGG